MKSEIITMEELNIGDTFQFINTVQNWKYTLVYKIDGYVGEFDFPWIWLDSQCSDRPYTPLYRIKVKSKYKGKIYNNLFTFTIDYKIKRVSKSS